MLDGSGAGKNRRQQPLTAGSMRVVYNGVDDIKTMVPIPPIRDRHHRFRHLTKDQCFEDMGASPGSRPTRILVETLASTAQIQTLCWMREKGIRLIPIYGRRPSDRRQIQVLGRSHVGCGRRRSRTGYKMLTDSPPKRGIEVSLSDGAHWCLI